MFLSSPPRFHSLLLLPALFSIMFLGKSEDNQPPVANPDHYTVHGVFGTPLDAPPYGVLKNDTDPDGDSIQITFSRVDFPQGSAFVFATGQAAFVRNNNYPTFSGSLSIQYPLCDNLGACSQGTVTFWLIGDGENDGATD